jgi:hypothetical protein
VNYSCPYSEAGGWTEVDDMEHVSYGEVKRQIYAGPDDNFKRGKDLEDAWKFAFDGAVWRTPVFSESEKDITEEVRVIE